METSELEGTVRQLEARAEEQFRDIQEKLRTASERLTDFVREKPGMALAGAFAVGYLIARAARR